MINFEAIAYNDSEIRNQAYRDLKLNGNKLEKKAVKYSEPVEENGVWKTKYFVAYPTRDV